jgi:hypothetical protein
MRRVGALPLRLSVLAVTIGPAAAAWGQPPPPPPVARPDEAPDEALPPTVQADTPPSEPRTPEPPPQAVRIQLTPTKGLAPLHTAQGKQRAVLLEDALRFDAAGKAWQALGKEATGEVGKALTRRINALAEAELGLAALAAGKIPDAVKKLRSAVVEQRAEQGQDLPLSAGLARALAWAEHAAKRDAEAKAALAEASQAVPAVWPKLERQLGEAEDEVPVGMAPLPGGQFAVAADVDLARKGGHKLRLWVLDAAGRPVRSLTWGGGGDDWPRAIATSPQGHVLVAGQSTSRGPAKAWLVGFDGSSNAMDHTLSGAEANALLAPANDLQFLAGSRDGRAWLARVQGGQVTAESLWGEPGCTATGLVALPGNGWAAPLRCGSSNLLGLGALPGSASSFGSLTKQVKLPSGGPCRAQAFGKSVLVACTDEATAVDPKSGKVLWTRRFPAGWQLPTLVAQKTTAVLLGLDADRRPTAWQLDAKGKPTARLLPAASEEGAPAGLLVGADWVTVSPLAGDVIWRRVPAR